MPQTGSEVTPTRTLATFDGSGVTLEMTFTTPALPDDLAILSRPATYLDFKDSSNEGAEHEVQITFTAFAEIAANLPDQKTDVASFVGFSADYLTQAIPEKALATMKEGKNVIAIHCHQGGLYPSSNEAIPCRAGPAEDF